VPRNTRSKSPPNRSATDLRRAISRQIWLGNRARNALRRPVFIGAISIATFVTAIVSMVVAPRTQQAPVIPIRARPETLSVAGNAALARIRLAQAESALVAARTAAVAASPVVSDSTAALGTVQRDSLEGRARLIERQLARAEQAPLPASYKAVAELPEIRNDPRVRALVDSLSDIEREREGFGAVGGVDPIFVALTSRANEIGRMIQAVADERLKAIRAEVSGLDPATPTIPMTPAVDTSTQIAARDSAAQAIQQATDSLTRLRNAARALDLDEERARERASAVAPPLALLASAFVLSAVIGFAVALIGELRRPRVSDANELERFLGTRVLSTVEAAMPSSERGRRQADRSAPPYFDPGAEGYQLAYLGLATEHPTLLTATVTGDDAAVAAIVACNLAAVAAEEARSTLVIDLEASCMASAALRARVAPGIVDILNGNASWPDARIAAQVGRDKTVDLVPFGIATAPPTGEQLIALLQQDNSRLARYYDAIFALAPADVVALGLASALPSPEVVYCARPGITPLRVLRDQLDAMRASGAIVRGVVLWNAPRPLLPTPRELSSKSRAKRASEPQVALATS
jgi:hypothetical protein